MEDLSPTQFRDNLTRLQRRALRELASDTSIVIKSADKGSGIVVEDREGYVRDGLAHLSDTRIYERVDSDPTGALAQAINVYVNTMHNRGIIDKITKDYLTFKSDKPPRTQQMYFLKKIHKSPTAVRPICSGSGGPTEKISQLIDMQLQRRLNQIPRDPQGPPQAAPSLPLMSRQCTQTYHTPKASKQL